MYVYPMLFCVSGEAGMDGWLWMVLDDVLFLVLLFYLIQRCINKKK